MWRFIILSILSFLCYVFIPTLAFCANPYTQPLSLSAYLQAVKQYNPQLNSAKEEVMAAQAEIGIAGLSPDPELTFSAESWIGIELGGRNRG